MNTIIKNKTSSEVVRFIFNNLQSFADLTESVDMIIDKLIKKLCQVAEDFFIREQTSYGFVEVAEEYGFMICFDGNRLHYQYIVGYVDSMKQYCMVIRAIIKDNKIINFFYKDPTESLLSQKMIKVSSKELITW